MELVRKARAETMTPEQRESQRQSFAYGNTNLENNAITRETVRRASANIVKQHANARAETNNP